MARLSGLIIEGGIAPHGELAFYKVGLLLLIVYDFTVIFSLFARKCKIKLPRV